jgi:beta-galactosidase/beta-glucuronidase
MHAQPPTDLHTAAAAAASWLCRYGEQDSRWVAFQVWNFSVTFSAEDAAKLAAQEQAVLYLGGVDTFGTVSINGQTVLQTDNFHR